MADIDFTNPFSIIAIFFVSIFSMLIIIVKFAIAPVLIPAVLGLFFYTMYLDKDKR